MFLPLFPILVFLKVFYNNKGVGREQHAFKNCFNQLRHVLHPALKMRTMGPCPQESVPVRQRGVQVRRQGEGGLVQT